MTEQRPAESNHDDEWNQWLQTSLETHHEERIMPLLDALAQEAGGAVGKLDRKLDKDQKAIQHGVGLAKAVGAQVTAVTVSTPFHIFAIEPSAVTDTREGYEKRMTETTAKYLGVVKDAAAASAVTCDTVHVEHEHPYQAIIDTAKKRGCDGIVMASHGRRGVSAIVLGSETVKVLTHSTIPVLVYR
jgi:nucleotide-binding universal stress UspA family protein